MTDNVRYGEYEQVNGATVNQLLDLLEETRKVLLHQVGDTRCCPSCGHCFIPADRTAMEANELRKKI